MAVEGGTLKPADGSLTLTVPVGAVASTLAPFPERGHQEGVNDIIGQWN